MHNPYLATPLSIAAYRLSTAPPDAQNQNVRQWLERLQASVRPPTRTGAANTYRNAGPGTDSEDGDEEIGVEVEAPESEGSEESVEPDKLIPDAAVPLGLFADLSLDQVRSGHSRTRSDPSVEEAKDGEDDDVVRDSLL